jgi:capsid protein
MPGVKPTLVDRFVGIFSPEKQLRNMAVRERIGTLTQFGYEAVNQRFSRGGSGGLFQNSSAITWREETDRVKLIWEARDQEKNIAFTRGILNRVSQSFVPKLRYQPSTGDEDVDKQYGDYVHEWGWGTTAGKPHCDVNGKHRLSRLVRLGYRSAYWRDGDCGFIMSDEDTGDGCNNIKLQAIEADRIGDVYRAMTGDEREVGGVVLGEFDEPVGYKIYRRTRTNQFEYQDTIPAENFIHLWQPFRFDMVRGHCPMAASLPIIRDLHETFHNDAMGIKFASSFAGFFEVSNPYQPGGPAAWDGKDPASGLSFMNAQGGKIMKLPDGVKFNPAAVPARPSGEFLAYVETRIREIALNLDLPFSYLWNLALFGGVTARLEVRYADQRFESDRHDLTEQMLTRVVHAVLMRGIANKEIPPHPNWKSGKWNWGAKISGDILNDTQARILAIQNGLTTKTKELHDAGESYEDIKRTQASEVRTDQRISAESEVPMELLDMSKPNATALLAAMNQRPDGTEPQVDPNAPDPNAPPPPSGLLASHDPKAMKPIFDLLKAFNAGQITYDQALGTLIQLYGMSQEEAVQILPVVKA